MRRHLVVLAVAAALLTVAAAPAVAGTPTVLPTGDFFALNVDVFPPLGGAGGPGERRGVTIAFDRFTGNLRTARAPRPSDPAIFRFQRGFRVNGRFLPQCQRAALEAQGPAGCPPGSVVGRGTAVGDVRPARPDPLAARITLFNGPPRASFPSLLIYAESPEVRIIYTGVFSILPRGPYGMAITVSPVTFQPPVPNPIEVTNFSVRTTDRTVTRVIGGRRVRIHYIEAPAACRGSWRFSETLVYSPAEQITNEDDVPCVPDQRPARR